MYSLMPSVCSFQLRNWILTELWPFVPEVVAMGVKGQHGAEPWTGIGRHGRCPSFKCRRGCGTRWKLLQNTKIIQKYISLNYNNLFLKTNVLRCNDVHVIHFFFFLIEHSYWFYAELTWTAVRDKRLESCTSFY